MQVILLKKNKNLGDVGDVVTVKKGYARNYLLPRGEVMRASDENIALFEASKREILARHDQERAEAEALRTALEGIWVSLLVQTGDDGRLFGSVTSRDIAQAISEQTGRNVPKHSVSLLKPIKYLGVHEVSVGLFSDIAVVLHVAVARSQDEANALKEQTLAAAAKPKQTEAEVIAEAQAAAEAAAPKISNAEEIE